jgi:hypothetical protein
MALPTTAGMTATVTVDMIPEATEETSVAISNSTNAPNQAMQRTAGRSDA